MKWNKNSEDHLWDSAEPAGGEVGDARPGVGGRLHHPAVQRPPERAPELRRQSVVKDRIDSADKYRSWSTSSLYLERIFAFEKSFYYTC